MRSAKAFAVSLAAVWLLVGCGGSARTPHAYSQDASLAALRAGGWSGDSAAGMPNTVTKARQLGYLAVTAPDGQQIDLQFFEDAPKAAAELATIRKQNKGFRGTTAANALVFAHPDGKSNVSSSDLDALEKLLK